MTTIQLMGIILFISLLLVGGRTGLNAFFGLFLNLFSVLFLTWLIIKGFNIYFSLLFFTSIILIINFFGINDDNKVTRVAFYSSLIIMLAACILLPFVVNNLYIHGFPKEELEELSLFSFEIPINFSHISLCLIIVSMMGSVTDAAFAISSSMHELENNHPNISATNLFQSGLSIGKDILTTTSNTLIFAFLGNYLALIIWVIDLNYSFQDIVNSQIVVGQLAILCLVGIFSILTLPLTSWIFIRMEKTGAPKN